MTFIYLTGFKEKTQKEPRCATVAHMVLTWAPGKICVGLPQKNTDGHVGAAHAH